MQCFLRWVVAFHAEARPIIDRYKLSRLKDGRELFPIYANGDGSVVLVLSGAGKVGSAAATAWLAAYTGDTSTSEVWINFGIAGGGKGLYGEVFLASAIRDESSGKRWFPSQIVKGRKCPQRIAIESVDSPREDYRDDLLFEMESAGFYPIAMKQAGIEFSQVVKVVSDDFDHPVSQISKQQVSRLCENALSQIDTWLDALLEIGAEESRLGEPPASFNELVQRYRFTATQQHQLKRLLQQWRSLNPEVDFDAEGAKNSGEILDRLRCRLWQSPLE